MEELEAAGCFDPPPPLTAAARTRATAGGLLPQRRGAELGRRATCPTVCGGRSIWRRDLYSNLCL
ncbi:protein of unknown function (plasmid) [Cupriavidus taiwanensis]|uniref:Uncharacterized protein n=1 Tax=Cupriavidus taiwanensis TaxID=164546 RepID=A0A375HBM3_9BURK|nr:protein of unknown function [Cupriavidus taiwanensis]SPD49132.1 protein of unknown function [Cupriavidus taiwanensis]